MKIQINEQGDLFIDNVEKQINDLNSTYLEKIVNDSLKDLIDYDIIGETPIANFFRQLQKDTSIDSELRNSINENNNTIEELKKQIDILEPKYLGK